MRFIVLFSTIALPVFFSCKNSDKLPIVQASIQQVKEKYAPDTRVAFFNLAAEQQGSNIAIKGMTIASAAKQELFQSLKNQGVEALDSVEVLPSPSLNGQRFGVVNVSVCNIRSNPKHAAELATQALLGTPLRVWKQEGSFFLIQTPDDYFGWLDSGGFQCMDSTQFFHYLQSERAVCTTDYVFAFEKPMENAPVVSDLLAGNILQTLGQEGGFTKIGFPDGRIGFVKSSQLMPLGEWLASRQPDAGHILSSAREMMGRPYLWGGTSGKGMDCSGFTKTVFFLNGLQLPRDASQQVQVGDAVESDTTLKNLLPGDLLFFGKKAEGNKKERITHVAIYMGNGKIIHAANKVETGSLHRGDPDFLEGRLHTFVRAKRMLGANMESGVVPLRSLPYYGQGRFPD
ncbi:MAG: C40 family peptidase [Saprospiraceae bacterium]